METKLEKKHKNKTQKLKKEKKSNRYRKNF